MQKQTICCEGWQYGSETDTCSPQCNTGCRGGICIKPDQCYCEPPAILDPVQKNACITPTCDPPCQNGECISNNICSCNEGYENINGSCQPKCDSCINGECKAPFKCECFEGFTKNDGKCEPVCLGCEFGNCTAPNNCVCIDGYKRTNDVCCPENCTLCNERGICLDGHCG